jgi:hypothetical protein
MFYDKSSSFLMVENWLVCDGWLLAARRTRFWTGGYLTGQSTGGIWKYCQYVCGEDKTKPRVPIYTWGTLECDDTRIPTNITWSNVVFRCFSCSKNAKTSQTWEDLPYLPTDCSQSACRAAAKKAYETVKSGCDRLPDGLKEGCKVVAWAIYQNALLACDACKKP